MERIVQSYVEQLQIGEEQSFKNLTVYPLFSSQQAYFAYLTLDEALIRGLVEIGEIDSQGSVPELRLTNNSDLMILILDGEELVGAKQNRIVNTTMLIPPQKMTTVIPVSCVEQGRWTYKTKSFYQRRTPGLPCHAGNEGGACTSHGQGVRRVQIRSGGHLGPDLGESSSKGSQCPTAWRMPTSTSRINRRLRAIWMRCN